MTRRVGWVLLLDALLAAILVPVFPHFLSPNEFSRWALAAAVVEKRTLEVSSVTGLLGPRFEDLSVKDGRTYSNKAPGGALVSGVGYLLARPLVGPPTAASMRPALNAMRLVGATLPVLLLGFLFALAIERFGGEVSRAPLLVFGLLFATPLFTYGLLLFSHALVAFALFGAFLALFLPAPRAAWSDLLGGALIGVAVLSEYPAAVPGLVLILCSLRRGGLPRLARIALGGAPFALLLGAYDLVCFGSVFSLSSSHEKFAVFSALATKGAFGIAWPSPAVILRLLLDPGRGLLVFSPFLLLAPRALGAAWFVLPRDAFVAVVLVPLSLLLLYAGYPNWHGGWAVGPRYLVAAIPFLLFPLAFRQGGRFEAMLLGASALAVVTTSLVFPFVPNELSLPWGSFALPLLGRGLIAPNLFHLIARPLALVVPPGLAIGAAALAIAPRRWPSFLFGAAATTAVALLLPMLRPDPLSARVARGYVEEVYFEQSGALARVLPASVGVPDPLRRRQAFEVMLPPRPWPF
ncbi:MAG: hypothetical protein ABIT01_15615 [Thermoanaerobaculia bacterium]